MKKITVLVLTLILPLVMAAGANALVVTVYTDKDAWSQACGDQFITETFTDNILHDPGVTYTTVMGSIALERWRDVLNVTSKNPAKTVWQFDPEITAFGGDWTLGGPGGSGNSLIVALEDFGVTVGYIPSSYYGDFWGFISDTPFSKVKLTGGNGSNQRTYFLDNMVYASVPAAADKVSFLAAKAFVAPAPLPSAIWLVGSGLLAIIGLRRLVR